MIILAIERMKLLSVIGKEEEMNNFIAEYLLDSGLQPEDALKVYKKGWKLSCFSYDLTARDTIKICKSIMQKLNIQYSEAYSKIRLEYKLDDIVKVILSLDNNIKNIELEIDKDIDNIKKLKNTIYPLEKLKGINIDLGKLYHLRYARYRYGKMPKEYYEKIQKDIEKMDAIIYKVAEENEEVWLIYLTTKEYSADVDSYFNVMKFERIWIPEEVGGVPEEVIRKININIYENERDINNLQNQMQEIKRKYEGSILQLYRQLETYEKINNVKKYLVHDEDGNFYVIGWIPTSELKEMMPKLKKEKYIRYKVKSHDEVATNPPTYLKNNKIFKNFESIVKMYGTPNYEEIDPTWFVAITAFLMFGFMFGDVGQGLVIAIIGIIMSKRKIELGPVFIAGGTSSIIFGILYGSVFGKENIIPAILISPMQNITTMLISGIMVGTILVIVSIILNITNGIKLKDKKRIYLEQNSLAGLLFYLLVTVSVVYYLLKGTMLIPITPLIITVLVLLFIIMFKDKIIKYMDKNMKNNIQGSFLEKAFEMFETLLSFLSNTISFVRLAAFAINHVGLCMAVYILSNMTTGVANLLIAIIGNIIVIVLEGLIVAIQVLRLEYYELFSRFYSGNGKEYKPLRQKIN